MSNVSDPLSIRGMEALELVARLPAAREGRIWTPAECGIFTRRHQDGLRDCIKAGLMTHQRAEGLNYRWRLTEYGMRKVAVTWPIGLGQG